MTMHAIFALSAAARNESQSFKRKMVIMSEFEYENCQQLVSLHGATWIIVLIRSLDIINSHITIQFLYSCIHSGGCTSDTWSVVGGFYV